MPESLSLYVHIPFCARHCAYCDFNVHVATYENPIVQQTVDAICVDIEQSAIALGGDHVLDTIFFGGGTPTFLSGAQLAQVMAAIRASFAVGADAEVSSEANPGSSDAEKFAAMRAAGFNRISIGVQSFDDTLLIALDRTHSASEAERAIMAARAAGFMNLSLDLMFALPRQTPALWRASLERAVAVAPEHLSLYALTLEPGTRFERLHAGGRLDLPGEEAELAMYEECISMLAGAGYQQYEVSSFARPGYRCRHNMVYWHNGDSLGVGPGAVSHIGNRRWKRERLPARYVRKVREGADLAVESESLTAGAALGETVMVGLRMLDGISLNTISKRFAVDVPALYADEIGKLVKRDLVVFDGGRLRLTHRGLILADSVAAEFVIVP